MSNQCYVDLKVQIPLIAEYNYFDCSTSISSLHFEHTVPLRTFQLARVVRCIWSRFHHDLWWIFHRSSSMPFHFQSLLEVVKDFMQPSEFSVCLPSNISQPIGRVEDFQAGDWGKPDISNWLHETSMQLEAICLFVCFFFFLFFKWKPVWKKKMMANVKQKSRIPYGGRWYLSTYAISLTDVVVDQTEIIKHENF